MTTIYLIRHAEAEGNLYRRIQGQQDARLTLRGLRQLEALEARFAPIHLDAVYSSGLTRTRLTAQAIAGPHGLTVRDDSRFIEIGLGPWEDKPFGELETFQPALMDLFSHEPEHWSLDGAESFDAFTGRFMDGLRDLAARHEGQCIAITTHGGVLRSTLRRYFPGNDGGHADNTAVTLLHAENGVFQIEYQNDNSHLTQELSTLAQQKWWTDPQGRAQDENLWFRPLDSGEGQLYMDFRQDAWDIVYPGIKGFDGPGFLADAWRGAGNEPRALVLAMLGTQVAGLLQLHMTRGQEAGAGYIPFFYLKPEYRGRGLGVQLVGHAISVFRPLGRTKLQLSVAPDNLRAIGLYEKCGFRIISPARRWRKMSLHLMEMDISADQTLPDRMR